MGRPKGYTHSLKSRRKMSKSRLAIRDEVSKSRIEWFKNNPAPRNPRSKPVIQMDFDGTVIKEWPSAYRAAKDLGIKQPVLCRALTQGRFSCGGFMWVYKKTYTPKYSENLKIEREEKFKVREKNKKIYDQKKIIWNAQRKIKALDSKRIRVIEKLKKQMEEDLFNLDIKLDNKRQSILKQIKDAEAKIQYHNSNL